MTRTPLADRLRALNEQVIAPLLGGASCSAFLGLGLLGIVCCRRR